MDALGHAVRSILTFKSTEYLFENSMLAVVQAEGADEGRWKSNWHVEHPCSSCQVSIHVLYMILAKDFYEASCTWSDAATAATNLRAIFLDHSASDTDVSQLTCEGQRHRFRIIRF